MVSEKLIIVLIIVAIILSVVSVAVTLSAVNTKMIPKIQLKENVIPDEDKGQVSLVIIPSENPPK